jgi:hypothetical protein
MRSFKSSGLSDTSFRRVPDNGSVYSGQSSTVMQRAPDAKDSLPGGKPEFEGMSEGKSTIKMDDDYYD